MDILEEHNLGDISDNYFRCGEALIKQVYSNDIEDFVAQFPIIYLFRHAFEVKLKQIIEAQTGEKVERGHSLHGLMNKIKGLDDWARKRLQELNEIDPGSTRLRYGGVGTEAKDYLGTDVRFFHEAMCALRDYLTAFAAAQPRRVAS
jgi:HEPN domain-containing protein